MRTELNIETGKSRQINTTAYMVDGSLPLIDEGQPVPVGMRMFALTERGKRLGSGQNNYSFMTAMSYTSANAYAPIFLQPIRLGV